MRVATLDRKYITSPSQYREGNQNDIHDMIFTETHARSVSEVETGQRAQSLALALVVKPALRRETGCIRKQAFIATDAVEIRLTVRLYTFNITALC